MPKLYPEDQEKVDRVLSGGVYKRDRKPFRPWVLLGWLIVVLALLTGASYWIAASQGFV